VCDSPSEDKESLEEKSESEEDESSTWSTTLAPRHSEQDSSGEPSVISCLKQFTAIELLTGNNKVGCETCTKRAGASANGRVIVLLVCCFLTFELCPGKVVCTNFTKQLLVSAPPGILTLHLKRFEVCGSQFRKVSKSVDFPLILDLASVCSVKCKVRFLAECSVSKTTSNSVVEPANCEKRPIQDLVRSLRSGRAPWHDQWWSLRCLHQGT